MSGWHHQLNGHEFEQAPGDGQGQTGKPGVCSPVDSQKSSLTLQFKSINSLVLSFLYGPTLSSIHDYWTFASFTLSQISHIRVFHALEPSS